MPSIVASFEAILLTTNASYWMDPIVEHMKDGVLIDDKSEAEWLRYKTFCSTLIDKILYK